MTILNFFYDSDERSSRVLQQHFIATMLFMWTSTMKHETQIIPPVSGRKRPFWSREDSRLRSPGMAIRIPVHFKHFTFCVIRTLHFRRLTSVRYNPNIEDNP